MIIHYNEEYYNNRANASKLNNMEYHLTLLYYELKDQNIINELYQLRNEIRDYKNAHEKYDNNKILYFDKKCNVIESNVKLLQDFSD